MTASLLARRDFPTLERHCYLNQAALGLIGRPAVQAMHQFIDDYARHGNCHMSDEDEAAYLDTLRDTGAKLFRCAPSHVAVIGCASEILAQIPLMLEIPRDSTVLAVASDFPAVTRPWLRQQRLKGCQIRFVEDRQSESLTDALIDAIDGNTSVVAVSSVQYATGTAVDIKRVSSAVSAAGGHLIVDATQELGARPVDTADWNADAVVCSGYKWLGGHGGVALAAISPELLEHIPPMTGWMGATDPFDFDARSLRMASDARRFTQSTMSYASVACLTTATEKLLTIGEPRIEAHASELASILVAEAGKNGWLPFRSLTDPEACSHIVSLSHPEMPAGEMTTRLAARGIVCSARCGRIRISVAPYNDESDIDRLVRALT